MTFSLRFEDVCVPIHPILLRIAPQPPVRGASHSWSATTPGTRTHDSRDNRRRVHSAPAKIPKGQEKEGKVEQKKGGTTNACCILGITLDTLSFWLHPQVITSDLGFPEPLALIHSFGLQKSQGVPNDLPLVGDVSSYLGPR